MKYIQKGNEPKELIEWKSNDKMFQRGNPKWNRLPTNIKELLRDNICNEQGYICCYCERELRPNDFHLEHIRPKDKNKFPEKQLDYDNLLCSCQLELEQGEPRHCGNSKGSWFQSNKFISPLNLECENRFKYTADGSIYPVDNSDDDAIVTIQRLKLDIDKLKNLRKLAIEPFLDENLSEDELQKFVDNYLIDKSNNNDKYNEFYTTIKYIFRS